MIKHFIFLFSVAFSFSETFNTTATRGKTKIQEETTQQKYNNFYDNDKKWKKRWLRDDTIIKKGNNRFQKVLVLRVIANDVALTTSAEDLSDYIFGTNGKNFTMKSQFEACSYGAFIPVPFQSTDTEEIISNGILEVHLNSNATGETAGTVVSAALSSAEDLVDNLSSNVDLLMICLPPGTVIGSSEDWKGYGYIDSYITVYNDVNCNYPSVQMHEIGHNKGLSHSNDESVYGDHSGLMGISYNQTDGPIECFNAPKSWDLGWYSESHKLVRLDELSGPISISIVGIANYQQRGDMSTIIRIVNSDDGYDYLIAFNRMEGINTGTQEGGDNVIVTKRPAGLAYQDSTVEVLLESKQTHTIYNVLHGLDLEINVQTIDLLSSPSYAQIGILLYTSCSDDNDCNDMDSCTYDLCMENKCAFMPETCSSCGAFVSLEIQTNDYPLDLTWYFENVNTEEIVESSGYYSTDFHDYKFEKCMEFARYKFSIAYSENTTKYNATFTLSINDVHIDDDEISEEKYIDTNFIICQADTDCIDYDGCTIDYCNNATNLCNNTAISDNDDDCINCSWLEVNITMDTYPDETTWALYEYQTNDLVLAGDPYTSYIFGYGRRSKPTRSARSQVFTRVSRKRSLIDNRFLESAEESVSETICIEKNYMLYFIIEDSFGDGICCSEGDGFYIISLNDTVIQEGGEFEDDEELQFKVMECVSDSDCDDFNDCTYEVCNAAISLCTYHHKGCSICGQIVTFDVFTDRFPDDTSWKIVNPNGIIFMHGGPYSTSFTSYQSSDCLPFGEYQFSIYDIKGDGLGKCEKGGNNCYFSLKKSREVITYSSGSFGVSESVAFSIEHMTPSSARSPSPMAPISPSPRPPAKALIMDSSTKPSFVPTSEPTFISGQPSVAPSLFPSALQTMSSSSSSSSSSLLSKEELFNQKTAGVCVKKNGVKQMKGVFQIYKGNAGPEKWKLQKCLGECIAFSKSMNHGMVTGCQAKWNKRNKGCYVHTHHVSKGSGKKDSVCWLFPSGERGGK